MYTYRYVPGIGNSDIYNSHWCGIMESVSLLCHFVIICYNIIKFCMMVLIYKCNDLRGEHFCFLLLGAKNLCFKKINCRFSWLFPLYTFTAHKINQKWIVFPSTTETIAIMSLNLEYQILRISASRRRRVFLNPGRNNRSTKSLSLHNL